MTKTDAFFGIVYRLAMVVLLLAVWSVVTQQLFNFFLSDLFFGLHLTFKQTFGLLAISQILRHI